MTELIGTHEIPCLSDTDYAAYALYMQCLAEKVEAQLVANRAAVDAALQRAVRVWDFSDAITQGSASGTESADGTQYSLNYPASFGATTLATLNLRGWWRIGALLRAVSSAPVAGNNRMLSFAIFPPNTVSSERDMTSGAWALKLQDITWETNTGNGETLYTTGEIYNPSDPDVGPNEIGMRMSLGISVENSGVETVTFSGIFWAIYLGDTPSISV